MKRTHYTILAFIAALMMACGGGNESDTPTTRPVEKKEVQKEEPKEVDPMTNIGIGPVKSVELGAEVDQKLAEEGKMIYEQYCTACHKTDKKYIGPAPAGILERRTPEWVMNMIINPTEMLEKDPTAKRVLAESNGAIMADQNISEEQARAILEYFRTL